MSKYNNFFDMEDINNIIEIDKKGNNKKLKHNKRIQHNGSLNTGGYTLIFGSIILLIWLIIGLYGILMG